MMSDFNFNVFCRLTHKKTSLLSAAAAFICLRASRLDETFYEYVKLGTSLLFTVTDCSPDFFVLFFTLLPPINRRQIENEEECHV
jgi:hypothetical protein